MADKTGVLTPKLIEILEVCVAKVMACQYGEVTILIEKGKVRRIAPRASIDYDSWEGVPADGASAN